MKLYLSNEEEGLTRETCHPKFNEILHDDFYISIIEEFAPFGNDDGWDTWRNLEKYYSIQGEKLFLLHFLDDYLLKRWGWSLFLVLSSLQKDEIGDILKLKEEKHLLTISPQIITATFFGQFKITGFVDEWIKTMMQNVIIQQSILTRHKKLNNEIDPNKLLKVVDGNSTRKVGMSKVFDSYLKTLSRLDSVIPLIPERKP